MKTVLSVLIFAVGAAAAVIPGVTESVRSDNQSHLANVKDFVNRRIQQAAERRLDNTCDDFVGSGFLDEELDCECTDSTDPNVIQFQCNLEAECAYAGTICSSGGTVEFTIKGFEELADLLEVELSQRQTSYDLEIIMSSCNEYISPDIGKFCFVLPMTNTVYLTTENLNELLKTSTSCEITLDGEDCACEMDKEDEYTGDGEEPCFKTDCSAVDDSFYVNICKIVVDTQDELQTSFLLPIRLVDEPDGDKSAETLDDSITPSTSDGGASLSSVAVIGIWNTLVMLGMTNLVTV